MLYHKQLIDHDPDNGKYGDCFRTVLACLLDVPNPEDVPHPFENGYIDWDETEKLLNGYLRDNFRLRFVEVSYDAENMSMETVLEFGKSLFGSSRYTLTGTSKIGVTHIVVCRGNEIEHCTSGNGLVGPDKQDDGSTLWWLGTLVKVL